MQIQKGLVKYKDRSDIICTYGATEAGKLYYFLDGEKLSNGYVIASTELVEAIDPLVVAASIGVIDSEGNEIIPCNNKSIKSINENILLVELAHPTSPSVLEAIDLRRDPLAATKLVSTSATIKEKMYAQMGQDGKFVFNDQFSEAMICDLEGHNLMGDNKYSFIGVGADRLYLSKNTADSPIEEYLFNADNTKTETTDELNVEDALISKDVIDSAMDKPEEEVSTLDEAPTDDSNGDAPAEDVIDENMNNEAPTDEVVEVTEEEKQPDINPVVPGIITEDSDFDDAGEEKSKTDDIEGEFSLFDGSQEDDLDKTRTLELPVVDSGDDYNSDINSIGDRRVDKYNVVGGYGFDADGGKDTVYDEAIVMINKLIGQIEEQRKLLASYEDKIEKLTEYRQRVYDDNKKLARRYDILLQEYKKLQADIGVKNDIISSQEKELARLKQQTASRQDLARLLEKAQDVFDEGYEGNYSKVKSL